MSNIFNFLIFFSDDTKPVFWDMVSYIFYLFLPVYVKSLTAKKPRESSLVFTSSSNNVVLFLSQNGSGDHFFSIFITNHSFCHHCCFTCEYYY